MYSRIYAKRHTMRHNSYKIICIFLVVDSKDIVLTQIMYQYIENNLHNSQCQLVPRTPNTWFLHSQLIFK